MQKEKKITFIFTVIVEKKNQVAKKLCLFFKKKLNFFKIFKFKNCSINYC